MKMLKRLRVAGWKSIKDQTIELRPLNVLIGGNGSGKSNLISFFRFLRAMKSRKLGKFVGIAGGANSLLHFGAKRTPVAEGKLALNTGAEHDFAYHARWTHTATDSLIFAEERVAIELPGGSEKEVQSFVPGTTKHAWARGPAKLRKRSVCSWGIARFTIFQDTSDRSGIRLPCEIEANKRLRADGSNLPAMLYLYKERHQPAYRRIVSAVRQAIPTVEDLVLEPQRLNPDSVQLRCKGLVSDYDFGPHQLSDGSLRFMALTTLLFQPEADLPLLIVIDEPELGLHPAALETPGGNGQGRLVELPGHAGHAIACAAGPFRP